DLPAPLLHSLPVLQVGGVEAGTVRLVVDGEHLPESRAVLGRDRAEHERALARVVAAIVEPVRGEAGRLRLAHGDELVIRCAGGALLAQLLEERVAPAGV